MLQDELLAKALQEIEAQVCDDGGVVVAFVAIVETAFLDQPGVTGHRMYGQGSPSHQEGLSTRLTRQLIRESDRRTESPDS